MQTVFVLFAPYFGPETVMPMTSILATIGAVVLMFGRTILPIHSWLGPDGLASEASQECRARSSLCCRSSSRQREPR